MTVCFLFKDNLSISGLGNVNLCNEKNMINESLNNIFKGDNINNNMSLGINSPCLTKEDFFNCAGNNNVVENKSKEYNISDNGINDSCDYTNNLLNIFLSCNSINENFDDANEYNNKINGFKGENHYSYNNVGKNISTDINESYNNSENHFNLFGNYNFFGNNCIHCKSYKNEIKNLTLQIKLMKEEILKYKQLIMSSGINEKFEKNFNSSNFSWNSTKNFNDTYEHKNYVSSIEAND